MRKWSILIMMTMGILTACADRNVETEAVTETLAETASASAEEEQGDQVSDVSLEQLVSVLGTEETEADLLLGGGKENWTADGTYLIGREYRMTLNEEPVTVYTICGEENQISAVSVWIYSEEHPREEGDTEAWIERINRFTGTEAGEPDTSSEAGSVNWQWKCDGYFMTLYQLGENLTLEINPLIGELQ